MGLPTSLRYAGVVVMLVSSAVQFAARMNDGQPPAFAAPLFHAARLTRFYAEHEPAKVGNVPSLLRKHAGKEAELYKKLEAKYETSSSKTTPYNVDFLATVSAAMGMGLARLKEHSPEFGKLSARWVELPLREKALRLVAGTLVVGFVRSPIDSRGRLRSFIVLLPLALAATVGPSPEDLSPVGVYESAVEFWRSLNLAGKLTASTAITLGLLTILPGGRLLLIVAWVICLLALTNPGVEEDDQRHLEAAALARTGVARTASEARSALKSLHTASFRAHDLGVLTVVSFSRGPHHGWTSTAVALGGADNWVAITGFERKGSSLAMGGLFCPLWVFPLAAIFALRFLAYLVAPTSRPPSAAV